MTEPIPTAAALFVAGALLVLSALLSRTSTRVGVPFSLVFLLLGMAAGEEGLGHIPFNDFRLSFQLGTVALLLILFDGGLNTSVAAIRSVAAPALVLATLGVAAMAGVTAVGAHLFGLPWPEALVLGAIVSSTDAAAVFAVLRASGVQLKQRVASVLEVESGLNDPMAVILTFVLTESLLSGTPPRPMAGLDVLTQLAVGTAGGIGLGLGGRALLDRARLTASGLYPVLTVAIAFIAFALPTLLQGSGFLAVFVAGIVLGHRTLPHQANIRRVHDAIAWVGQIGMFLVLGLLVTPSHLLEVAPQGIAMGLFAALVARPLVVALFLLPFRLPGREVAYVGWVGLRGAVPIVLATMPVMAGAPQAERIFNIVFFMVVVNALLPGWTVRWLARRIGLEAARVPHPSAVLEISAGQPVNGELLSFYVGAASAVAGSSLADIPFPEGTTVVLVVRGRQLIAPKGATVLRPGDHVQVLCGPAEKPFVQLLFGEAEVE